MNLSPTHYSTMDLGLEASRDAAAVESRMEGKEEEEESFLIVATPAPVEDGHLAVGSSEPEGTTGSYDLNSEKASLIPKYRSDGSVALSKDGREGEGKSSIGGASFNFINSIVGSGIIGIPSALQRSGFIFGVFLLLFVAAITDYTVLLLIKDGILAKTFTYQGMVTKAYGQLGYWYLTMVQFLFPFFAMSGYVVIVGDTLSRVLHQIFYLVNYDPPYMLSDRESRDIVIKIVMVVFVMLPICLLRNISKLEKFSAFAIFCIVFTISVTLYEISNLYCSVRCFHSDVGEDIFTTWFINKSFVQGIGIMGGAFVCHHNTYLIYASLSNRSLKRFSIVSHISVSTSFIFTVVLGVSGLLSFLDQTQGNLLNNYCLDDPAANSARFFFACVIMLTYPIECFVGREVLEIALSRFPVKFVEKIRNPWLNHAVNSFLYAPHNKSLIRHIVLTLLIVFATMGIGLSTNDLGVVLAFNGCFTAVPLAFIIPTACYLKLSERKWCSWQKLVAFLVMLFGVLVMVIGTVLAILEAVQSYIEKSTTFTPQYCLNSDTFANTTCCQVFESTQNFSTSIALCDCKKLCPDPELLPILSSNFCNFTSEYY